MPQRYDAALKEFIRQWRPNDPELDRKFIEGITHLLAEVTKPPANQFEVTTILSNKGGKVIVRLADYEAQMDPLDAQHLALSLVEAATSARTESWLYRFLQTLSMGNEIASRMIGEFRNYRMEEMQRELQGDFERRSVPLEKKD